MEQYDDRREDRQEESNSETAQDISRRSHRCKRMATTDPTGFEYLDFSLSRSWKLKSGEKEGYSRAFDLATMPEDHRCKTYGNDRRQPDSSIWISALSRSWKLKSGEKEGYSTSFPPHSWRSENMNKPWRNLETGRTTIPAQIRSRSFLFTTNAFTMANWTSRGNANHSLLVLQEQE